MRVLNETVFLLAKRSEEEESTLHDYPIYEICAIAESLGYNVEEKHLAGEHGPDIIIRNRLTGIGVIIESEVGHNITVKCDRKFAPDHGRSNPCFLLAKRPTLRWSV